jgi:hypothetical protein
MEWPEVGQRVRLKKDRFGIIWKDNNYTSHKAYKDELGTVYDTYNVMMDNKIEIGFYGNDFSDPPEQFAEFFELINS